MAELTITVNLAGRSYRLTVDVTEEEVIRKAATFVGNTVESLRRKLWL